MAEIGLDAKVAIFTGPAQGLGKVLAGALARACARGAFSNINGRRREKAPHAHVHLHMSLSFGLACELSKRAGAPNPSVGDASNLVHPNSPIADACRSRPCLEPYR
jgi:NAD(P)-dependent dehydrogenase (short-subunit alcohol dehydrogenase family)